MSGWLTKRRALIAVLLVVGAAIAVPTTLRLSDVVRSGHLITRTDWRSAGLSAHEPVVGDVVMFGADMPEIASGASIAVLGVTLAKATPGIKLIGARRYERKDFGGSVLLAWQTKNGDLENLDPHGHPSTDLAGTVIEGNYDPERFIMFEFMVCAPGELSIDELDVKYKHKSDVYHQILKVSFDVRGAKPGVPCT